MVHHPHKKMPRGKQTSITNFLTTSNTTQSAAEHKPKPRQLRLNECGKVVRLEKPAVLYTHDDVLRLKHQLSSASRDDVLHALRTLSCCSIGYSLLKTTGVGVEVKALRRHDDAEVAKLAAKLLDKWRAHVLSFGCTT